MKYRHLVVLIIVMLAVMGSVRTALADGAPPDPPAGSSVDTGAPSTYVQMVSESVVMTITDYNGPPVSEEGDLVTDMMVGHVQAYFKMVNQGTDTETFDVYFPLNNHEYPAIKPIDNLTAYVDGQIAETETVEIEKGDWGYVAPWAIWEVTFPPGQTVNLDVEYDVHPQGSTSWGGFTYVLETGAGWYGPIGEGTITLRLPYEVNEFNAVLGGEKYMPSPNPSTYAISGTDVVWHFSDLEPTREDNIHLTVLVPSIGRDIQQAQAAVQADPGSVDARLQLARALSDGLTFKHGLTCCLSLADEAISAYEQALELDPNNVDIYVAFLDLLASITEEPFPEQFLPTLEHALALDPENERLLELQSWYDSHLDEVALTFSSGKYPTMVQMESQNVLMTIADDTAHVNATFNMRNQGTEEEAFDVRLLIGTCESSGRRLDNVHDVTAYVDGEAAEVGFSAKFGADCEEDPWATWRVTFPPNQMISLEVSYQVDPDSYSNRQGYTYFLHTEAGWFGPIGEGTITVRLPYEVNDLNMFVNFPSGYAISGTDVVWHFTDFKANIVGDIMFNTVPPPVWKAIQSAQREVEENPDLLDAHLGLARMLISGLAFCATDEQMLTMAEEEYKQALEIAPNNVDIYIDYIGVLGELNRCDLNRQAQIAAAVQSAREIDPGNEKLAALLEKYELMEFLTPTPEQDPTRTPNSMVTGESTSEPISVIPTSIPTLIPTSQTTITPPISLWVAIGAVVIGGAAAGVWVYRKRRAA